MVSLFPLPPGYTTAQQGVITSLKLWFCQLESKSYWKGRGKNGGSGLLPFLLASPMWRNKGYVTATVLCVILICVSLQIVYGGLNVKWSTVHMICEKKVSIIKIVKMNKPTECVSSVPPLRIFVVSGFLFLVEVTWCYPEDATIRLSALKSEEMTSQVRGVHVCGFWTLTLRIPQTCCQTVLGVVSPKHRQREVYIPLMWTPTQPSSSVGDLRPVIRHREPDSCFSSCFHIPSQICSRRIFQEWNDNVRRTSRSWAPILEYVQAKLVLPWGNSGQRSWVFIVIRLHCTHHYFISLSINQE